MTKRTPIADRFWAKVDRDTDPDGCWMWTGARLPSGYPRFFDGRSNYGHRASYELNVGAIPDGMTIDHICNNPPCVRPDHLRVATQRDNILRSNGEGAKSARKTHCKHGHSLADAYKTKAGHRICRTCVRLRDAGRIR